MLAFMELNAWVITHKDVITFTLGSIAAGFTLITYRGNLKIKRAEFIYKLHADFFGSAASPYRAVRAMLDSDEEADRQTVLSYLREEPEQFTDYLNFFEMVAYLYKQGQITLADVKALFGYYLKILQEPVLKKYIQAKDFENLFALLTRLK